MVTTYETGTILAVSIVGIQFTVTVVPDLNKVTWLKQLGASGAFQCRCHLVFRSLWSLSIQT